MYTVSIRHSSRAGLNFPLCFYTGSDNVIDCKFRYAEKIADCTEAIKIKSAITHLNFIVSH